MLKFFFDFKPMDKYSLNWIAIFNETALLFSYLFMYLFTDFVKSVEFRYSVIGRAYIYYEFGIFAVNLTLISFGLGTDILYNIRARKYKK